MPISDLDKKRLFDCAEDGGDYILLAQQLRINKNTAKTIVRRLKKRNGVISLPCGGAHNIKVDDEMKEAIVSYVEENCQTTLKEIKEKLEHQFPTKPKISTVTIMKVLDGALYSVKKISLHTHARNSEETKNARVEYVNWFLSNLDKYRSIIFLDESGFNLWTRRSNGRAPKGHPAVRIVSGSKGKNVTMLFAISPQLGKLSHKFVIGSVTNEIFQSYFQQLCEEIGNSSASLFILDNAPIHNKTTHNFHTVKFLPPYSPVLNPIEEAFSCWKYTVKNQLAQPDYQRRIHDSSAAAEMGSSMVQYRRGILEEVAESSLNEITSEKIVSWYNHSFSFFSKCINKENV